VGSQEASQAGVEIIDVDLLDAQGFLNNNQFDHQIKPQDPILVDSDSEASMSFPGPSRQAHKALAPLHEYHQTDVANFRMSVDIATDPVFFSADQELWTRGTATPYAFLAHVLSTLSGTRSRILILNTLTNAFRLILKFDPSALSSAIYLLSNTLSPSYESVELGLGPSIISKAIQQVSGLTPSALKRLYNSTGDPGDVAFAAKSNLRTLIPHPPLRLHGVFSSLIQISRTNGHGAARQKQKIVENLLIAARGEETRFLVRTLCQNLRVGAVRTSIITALARAVILTPPSSARVTSDSPYHVSKEFLASVAAHEPDTQAGIAKKKVSSPERIDLNQKFVLAETLLKQVFVQHPNFDHISAAILETGLDHLLDEVPITVG
jgi:DNA ligase 1